MKEIYVVVDREYDVRDELIRNEILIAFAKEEDAMDYVRSVEIPLTDGVVIDYFDESQGHRAVTYVDGNVRDLMVKKVEMKL